ncbi:SAM-dependent methyltransferase [Micromonospora fulviviridis]|uniref:SAM-dependent methyltransferase n=1 Tax=Micromonospora fulviviridis TaxID=47860 RepID=A0ABV2VW14_9ACTN
MLIRDGQGERELPAWVPPGTDLDVPNAARMYDYALGGYHNFAIDRDMVKRAETGTPGARRVAHANRAFLGRAVRWLVVSGIRQFLDLGSGIPTLGNVHEVAQKAAPDARVVYVDVDPVAVQHSAMLLAGNPLADVIQADVRRPADVLASRAVADLLDFTKPVAVLMIAVLHFVSDADDPAGIVAQFTNALVPGSFVAISHGTRPPERLEDVRTIRQLYKRTPTPLHLRDRREVAKLVAGLQVVEPGVVPVSDWHPDPDEVADVIRDELLVVLARKAGNPDGSAASRGVSPGTGPEQRRI